MGLVITIALCGLSGCTSNSTTVPQETTPPEITSGEEETSTEEESTTEYDNTSDVYGRVDAEDICKHLVIDGKQVDFPWTLNALGDEYDFDEPVSDENGLTHAAGLYYNDNLKFVVGVWDDGEVDRDSLIYYFSFGINEGVSLYDFKKGDTMSNVIEKLGEPDEIDDEGPTTVYRYWSDDIYLYMSFFTEDEKLRAIGVEIPKEVLEGEDK